MDGPARNRGSAIREAAIVLLVLAILLGVVAQSVALSRLRVAGLSCEENVTRINQAIELWYFDHRRWPADDLRDIALDPSCFPDGLPRCPVTGMPYRMDPAAKRVVPHRH